MAAPYDESDVNRRAERLADPLRLTGSYRADTWSHPVLGPLVRVYVLLTERPQDAFDKPVTPEYVAECRTYAYVLLAALYDALSGADTLNDGCIDLLTQYDSLADADLVGAMETAKTDAAARLAELKKSDAGGKVAPPGVIRRTRRKPGT